MLRYFLTNPTTQILMYRNFYPSNFYLSSFNLNLLRPTPLNCSLTHKALVFLLSTPTGLGGFSSTTFLSDFNNLLVFLLSFLTELGGFLLIDLFGFFPQFSYWVRRFFHQDKMIMFPSTTYYQLFNFLLQLPYRARRFSIIWSSWFSSLVFLLD